MFGISFSEILLILVISLLIFGPEQLPQIAAKLGKFVTSIRNFGPNLREQIYEQSGFNQFDNIRSEMQQALAQLRQQLPSISKIDSYYPHHNFITEDEVLYQEYNFLYQPELEFEREPELFDE